MLHQNKQRKPEEYFHVFPIILSLDYQGEGHARALHQQPITEGHMLMTSSTTAVPELLEHWPEELCAVL